jgi:hypothetical protein
MSRGMLIVESQEAFDKWLAAQTPASAGGGTFE